MNVRFELRDLAYFLACLDEGSLTAAARRSHVAQPTMSHAIARLEAQVGERLLERLPRAGVRATDAGRLLALRARGVLASVNDFTSDLSALRGLHRGHLRIGAIQSLNVTLLPGALARFSAAHPGIELDVRTYPADAVVAAVRDAQVDLAVVAGLPAAGRQGVDVTLLYREVFVAIVRADDPLARRRTVALRALRDRHLALVPAGSYTGTVIHAACARAGFAPRVRLTLDSGEALREAVRAGLGATILPERYLLAGDTELKAVRLQEPVPRRDVVLVRPRSATRSRASDAFVEVLRAHRAPGARSHARFSR